MTKQNALTIITPIAKNKYDDLFEYLKKIRLELEANKHEQFEDIGTIHYCRWVVIDHPHRTYHHTTDESVKAKLVFTSNYDGPKSEQLKDLCTKAAQILDDVYSYCEGYPLPSERTPESRMAYLNKHFVKTTAFYQGSPGRTLNQIRNEENLRNTLKKIIENGKWDNMSCKQIHGKIKHEVFAMPEFSWLKEKVQVPTVNYFGLIGLGIILLALLPLIIPFVLIIHFFYEKNDDVFMLKRSQLREGQMKLLESYEDLNYQNQFSQLVVMKKGMVRLIAIKALFAFANALIRNLFVTGKLMGIPTIHFARWVMFDDNKRVLFFSNFDGSWQQYLGDFIDKSGWGLTGIFSNTTNFPKTNFLLTGGAYDEEHFLAWSRSTEIPTEVWYDAYPHLSIKNVNNNTRIRTMLTQSLSEQCAQDFLKII
jgi:hypothetical protein